MSRWPAYAAAALVAFALPSALAAGLQATHPNDRAGPLGPGATTTATLPDALDRYLETQAQPVVASTSGTAAPRPDNRAGTLGPTAATATAATSSDTGFDWRDAGIGAAITAVALLLGGWIVFELRIHRGGRGGLLTH